jgi:hypothetical protein
VSVKEDLDCAVFRATKILVNYFILIAAPLPSL